MSEGGGTLHRRNIKTKPLKSCQVRPKSAIYTLSEMKSIPVDTSIRARSSGSPGSLSPRGVQSEKKKVRQKKKTETKQKQVDTGMSTSPVLFCSVVVVFFFARYTM